MRHIQRGFSLVEMLVAMAIGTVITLAAGQLFLTTFQTFQTVDKISRQQEALVFAANMLTEAGRKGNIGHYAIVPDERNSGSDTRHYCVLQDTVENEPVVDLAQVDGTTACPALSEPNGDEVSHSVTLPIGDCRESVGVTCDHITFTISERNKAISPQEPTS